MEAHHRSAARLVEAELKSKSPLPQRPLELNCHGALETPARILIVQRKLLEQMAFVAVDGNAKQVVPQYACLEQRLEQQHCTGTATEAVVGSRQVRWSVVVALGVPWVVEHTVGLHLPLRQPLPLLPQTDLEACNTLVAGDASVDAGVVGLVAVVAAAGHVPASGSDLLVFCVLLQLAPELCECN